MQHWSLVLNVLKLLGAAITGISGLIGILTETKNPDKTLTKAGRRLLFFGVLGLLTALSSQIAEWAKGEYDAQQAQVQNAATLSEIRRAVTRIESASVDLHMVLPTWDSGFSPYVDHLNSIVAKFFLQNLHVGSELDGLRAITGSASGINVLRIDAGSPAMPVRNRYAIAGEFVNIIPRIAIYKKAIDSKLFFPDSEGNVTPTPDMVLFPDSGTAKLTAAVNDDEKLAGIALDRTDMTAPPGKWSQSNAVVSIEDLQGAQAIM